MADFSLKNVQLTAAKVYIAPFDPESTLATNMPKLTISSPNDNVDNVISYIDANYWNSFQRMAGFKNVVISDILENDVVNEVDDCDIGEWSKTTDLIPQFTGDWLTTLDLDAIKILLGFNVVAVPGTEVEDFEQVIAEGWGYNNIYRLEHQNHDANGVIIAPTTLTVKGSVDGALVLDTDYKVVDNGFGEFGIMLLAGGAITTLSQNIELEYHYTPIAAEYTGYLTGQTIQPFMIVKIVGCPDPDNNYDIWYIVKASLSGSLDTNFVATGEVPLSSITLRGGKGGFKLVKKQRI